MGAVTPGSPAQPSCPLIGREEVPEAEGQAQWPSVGRELCPSVEPGLVPTHLVPSHSGS